MTDKNELSTLEQQRLEKLEALQAHGVNAFPAEVERTHTTKNAATLFEEQEKLGEEAQPVKATLVGRIRSMRPMGKVVFAHVEDGEGRVQFFFRANDIGPEKFEEIKKYYDLGDYVEASGEMFRTRTGEVSLRVADFRLISKALSPLPAGKEEVVDGEVVKHAGLSDPETRYRQRYADLAVNEEVREIFKIRSGVTSALREYMDTNGFLEVETPILQPIYGGAAARPFITHHNQLKQDLYLRISFELYLKRLIVGGFERVYEIGRDFRNEGVDRTHNPEFTQLEFYMAYADYKEVMTVTEKMVAHVARKVHGTTKVQFQGQEIDFGKAWHRVELSEGILELAGIDINACPDSASLAKAMKAKGIEASADTPRGKLIDDLISDFLEPNFIQPTFLYNYPRDISPLAKNIPGDPTTVERFEGFIAGFEICNAFSELNDPIEQEKRFLEMGRDYDADDDQAHPMDEDYLRAMRYGMPPMGGFGIGVDRLVMLMTDKPNIREVILFPHLREIEG